MFGLRESSAFLPNIFTLLLLLAYLVLRQNETHCYYMESGVLN